MRRAWHVWRREEVYIGFWWINPKVRDYLEDTDEHWWTAIKWVFQKWDRVIDWLDLNSELG